ncbi:nose resistant to fluoxetine protein 6 [Caerostris extrusa]|uniref:Nose resistant to fluoxetine protein 6 n=1 Tax=Caerostris extrusa TaxID=172846 RepID=A0AAV4QFK3_CAEEX|nr:nose resistant to fluoxetine protein 6 [Caerostris extrusa]
MEKKTNLLMAITSILLKMGKTEPLSKSSESSGNTAPNHCKSFLKCFCVSTNGKKILSVDSKEDQFGCIHGIRVFSNVWVTLFHISLVLYHGFDGFLNGYIFSSDFDKNYGQISWFHFYIKRFIRLTPVYMIVLGIYTTLLCYMCSGPLWPTYLTNPVCRENWWWNLIYVNNLESSLKQCMAWCWYLAADMQFYIISPLFLVSLMRSTSIAMNACPVQFWEFFDMIYTKPYTRISSYLVGIVLGHYLYKRRIKKKEAKSSMVKSCAGWIMTAVTMWICFFALYKREECVTENALYNGLKHLLFSCGLSWIVFVCVTQQGGRCFPLTWVTTKAW